MTCCFPFDQENYLHCFDTVCMLHWFIPQVFMSLFSFCSYILNSCSMVKASTLSFDLKVFKESIDEVGWHLPKHFLKFLQMFSFITKSFLTFFILRKWFVQKKKKICLCLCVTGKTSVWSTVGSDVTNQEQTGWQECFHLAVK